MWLKATLGSMFDFRIICREVEVRAVGLRVALHAADRRRYKPISLSRLLRVLTARPVARFALNVGKLRSRILRLESALLEAHYVALNAARIVLLAPLFQVCHRMGVIRILPDVVLALVAGGACFDASVGRGLLLLGSQYCQRRLRGGSLLRRLRLLISEIIVGAGHFIGGRRIIRDTIVQADVAGCLFYPFAARARQ